MLAWDASSDYIDVGQTGFYHHLFDIRATLSLDCDVTIRAVDDASFLKTPTVVFHALNCRFIFAGESYACQTAATVKRIIPNARHARRDRHRRQTATVEKRPTPDARHARGNRHIAIHAPNQN